MYPAYPSQKVYRQQLNYKSVMLKKHKILLLSDLA